MKSRSRLSLLTCSETTSRCSQERALPAVAVAAAVVVVVAHYNTFTATATTAAIIASPLRCHLLQRTWRQATATTMASTNTSSSPGLPSPSSFFHRCPTTTAGSPPLGFQKASSLLNKPCHFAAAAAPTAAESPKSAVQDAPKKAPESRKPRKKLAKSASTILNSDDLASTQFRTIDAAELQGNRHSNADHEQVPRNPAERKAARKPKKTPKEPAKVLEKSAYFAQSEAAPNEDSAIEIINKRLPEDQKVQTTTSQSPLPVQAHRRRISWTPPRNTTNPERQGTILLEDADDAAPALSLATVLGSFSYAKPDSIKPARREPSGEALIKRRRFELADEATVAPKAQKAQKAADSAAAQPAKKVKAPKKKVQTITELATKAYRLEEGPADAQATVSSFFAPAKADVTEPMQPAETTNAAEKSKKPRKPRAKKSDGDAAAAKPAKAAKSVKATKSAKKVRINEADCLAPLYEPERARKEEQRQDFLFGTSSQLGVEDSPTFIRQMQLAVSESEALAVAPVSPSRKSCKRVASAPHGTSLSIGQAGRELWCSAARDLTEEVYGEHWRKSDPAPRSAEITLPQVPVHIADDNADRLLVEDSEGRESRPQPSLMRVVPPVQTGTAPLEDSKQPDVVDLCDTSPIEEQPDVVLPVSVVQNQPLSPTQMAENIDSPKSDDEWMLLKSDDSSPAAPKGLITVSTISPMPSLKRSATSPIRRSALQTLDANVSPLPLTSPRKELSLSQHRQFTARATPASPPKRPRGRPRKDQSSTGPAPAPAKRQSKPSKEHSPARAPVVPHSKKVSKVGQSASQPVPSSSSFINIDEISDTESPNSPSPPRRRATSSPPAIRTLDLEVTTSPWAKAKSKAKEKEKVTLAPKIKADYATWTTIMPALYRNIMSTIKSTPPSNDMANPTWHEKILLYDPIVLEDLTKWLNDQGVRIELQQVKAVPKTKGRKKKANVEAEPPPAVEYETVQHELMPWMVQKWCEEKSVCCLWREGLRGGVRTKY